MRILILVCLLVCVLFVTAERTAQRKRSPANASNGLQVSAARVTSRSRNGALIQRSSSTSGVRRSVTRARSAVGNKRQTVRSRSNRSALRRGGARRRFAKQEESDLDQNSNQGFGEETTSGTDAGSDSSATDNSNTALPAEQPASENDLSSTSNGSELPAQPDNSVASQPANLPTNTASNGNNPISAGGFGGFPGNFKFPSFPGNGAVGAGFAQSQGPGIAFGAGFATSNGRQSSSGGFGAAFSAPNFGLAQPQAAAQPSTEAPAEEELAQIRRRPR